MSEAELISRIDALEAQLAELRQVSEDAYDVGCEYPGEGTEYQIEIPTQQVFGGGGGEAKSETPYAWRVRAVTPPEVDPETPEEERPSGFQVFAPYAVISQATLPTVPDGFTASATWQDVKAAILPASSSGAWTLYAILKHTPAIPASGSGSSATEAQPAKTEFLISSSLPDTSSDPAGTQYRLFHIATRAADGTLTQIQAGPIIETFPPASVGGLCAGPLTYDSESGHIVQYLGTFGEGGAFTKAKGASGQPIIATDYGAALKALKMGATGDKADAVFTSTGFSPLNSPGSSMIMSKQTVNGLTLDLNYKAPQYEDDVGGLQARTGVSVTYWGYQPTTGSTTTLLQTITEPANEKTIYEDGSSQA